MTTKGIYHTLVTQLDKLARHNRQGSFRTKDRYYEAVKRFCAYHYGLTGSWRDSLPKLSWPEWVSLCTLLGRPLMRSFSAQVVFAHSA